MKLDLDTLLDLFEAAGITLEDDEALDCLSTLPANILGRHSIRDVLVWYKEFQFKKIATKVVPTIPLWRKNAFAIREYFLSTIQ